jgi:hypothetical protein
MLMVDSSSTPASDDNFNCPVPVGTTTITATTITTTSCSRSDRIQSRKRKRTLPLLLLFLLTVSTCCVHLCCGESSSRRSSSRAWDCYDDSCSSGGGHSGNVYLSESDGEERIISALDRMQSSDDGGETWTETMGENEDDYEQETLAGASTDTDTADMDTAERPASASGERQRLRSPVPHSTPSHQRRPIPGEQEQEQSESDADNINTEQNQQESGRKRLQYVNLPDTYRVGGGSSPTTTATTPTATTKRDTTATTTTEPAAPKQQQQPPQTLQSQTTTPSQPQHTNPTTTAVVAPTATNPVLTTPWVRKFLASCHRDVLLPVPNDYCTDNFNLAQLAPVVERIGIQGMNANDSMPTTSAKSYPIYREALRLIVQDEPLPAEIPDFLQRAARALYLLIHQRYVLSPRGLDMVRRRFLLKRSSVDPIFGRCPRLSCAGMPLLPFSDSDNLEPLDQTTDDVSYYKSTVPSEPVLQYSIASRAKRYCASCEQVFYHWDSKVDGSAWGPCFCHLFLMVFGAEVFAEWKGQRRPSPRLHEPRIFGFRLHASARDRMHDSFRHAVYPGMSA